MDFNKYMKLLREQNNYTQEEASDLLGVSCATVQNWERGTSKPELASLSRISRAYRVSTEKLIHMLALDLEIVSNDAKEDNRSFRYKDLFDNDIDYSKIDKLYFNKDEQELFIIFALNVSCLANPIEAMYRYTSNYLEVSLFIDKIENLGLYFINKNVFHSKKSYNGLSGDIVSTAIELTEKGKFIFNKIKETKGKLFDVYNLGFKDFINICKMYNAISNLEYKLELIKQICETPNYLVLSVNGSKYTYVNSVRAYYNRRDDLEELLSKDYYTFEKVDSDGKEYLEAKTLYERKLEFYEKNKELAEGLIYPTKYNEQYNVYARPTKKSLKIYDILKKEGY